MKASTTTLYILYLLIASFMFMTNTLPYTGMICVPVADLLGQPMHELYPHGKVKKMYDSIPVCGASTHAWQGCPRLHQALLHELVDVIEERDQELCIKVHNIFYITPNTQKHTQTFWTLKSNIVKYDTIQNKPPHNAALATCTHPTHIRHLNITVSAGTRYALAKQLEYADTLSVYLYNAKKNSFDIVDVPRTHSINTLPAHPHERIRLFVRTVRAWANQETGIIPYVLGGCSFKALCPDGAYTIENLFYTYPTFHQTIKTGLDCSGLISRAAQLCGIPYFCKNSITAAKTLTTLKKNTMPQPGDLLWFPGHLIIIADLDRHTIVEARGYEHGYGKVHEIPLCEQFDGIHTYADLLYAYHHHIPLKRRDKSGTIVQTIPTYALYSLASVFDTYHKHATHNTGLS